jgi:hypothetical protein
MWPEKSTSKLLDKDGGDCNCFKTESNIFLSPSKAKMWRLQLRAALMLAPVRKCNFKGLY